MLQLNNQANPTVVKPGFKKVVPGLGMNRSGQTGNLSSRVCGGFPRYPDTGASRDPEGAFINIILYDSGGEPPGHPTIYRVTVGSQRAPWASPLAPPCILNIILYDSGGEPPDI
jgi:hypothetical protein